MSDVTVHTDRAETPFEGVSVTVTDGGVLKLNEESGRQIWYSPSGWNRVEIRDGQSKYEDHDPVVV